MILVDSSCFEDATNSNWCIGNAVNILFANCVMFACKCTNCLQNHQDDRHAVQIAGNITVAREVN